MKELLKLAGIPRSTFYYQINSLKKEDKHKGRYGYRRITQELRNSGYKINHKTVAKLMKTLGLKSIQRAKRKYSSYQGTVGKIADNLLNRNFKADKPNQKWATDITEFKVRDEKLYLSPIFIKAKRNQTEYVKKRQLFG